MDFFRYLPMLFIYLLTLNLFGFASDEGSLSSASINFEKLPRFGISVHKTIWVTATTQGDILVTAHGGGSSSEDPKGELFRYSPKTRTLDSLFQFGGEQGSAPSGPLVQTDDPNILYGVTHSGGQSDCGTIYEFDLSARRHKVLFHFNETGPHHPSKGLVAIGNNRYIGLCDTTGEPRDIGPYFGGPYEWVPFLYDRLTNQVSFFNPKPEYGYVIGLPCLLNEDVLVLLYEKGTRHRIVEYSLTRNEVTSDVRSTFWFKPNGSLIKGKDSCLYVMHYYVSASSATYPFFCYDAKTKTCTQRALGSPHVTMYSGEAVADRNGVIYGWFNMGPRTMPHGLAFRFNPVADSVEAFIEWKDKTSEVDELTNEQLTPGYEFISNPVIAADGMLYAVSEDSGLVSIDLATRKVKRLVKI
jgi:uncharacterized repeat protein (TIGR03803 family)